VNFRTGPANKTIAYVATNTIIEEVNNIFGPNGWSSQVTNLQQDFIEEIDGRYTCGCSAIVKIILKNGTFHEDIGYGVAIKQKTMSKAIETAKKTAVSDGLKRALRQFGHALGNCLSIDGYTDYLLNNVHGRYPGQKNNTDIKFKPGKKHLSTYSKPPNTGTVRKTFVPPTSTPNITSPQPMEGILNDFDDFDPDEILKQLHSLPPDPLDCPPAKKPNIIKDNFNPPKNNLGHPYHRKI